MRQEISKKDQIMISEITDKAKKLYEENEELTDLDVNSELKNLRKSNCKNRYS